MEITYPVEVKTTVRSCNIHFKLRIGSNSAPTAESLWIRNILFGLRMVFGVFNKSSSEIQDIVDGLNHQFSKLAQMSARYS